LAEAPVPILVRPVREQLEHDRVIRLLQARWRRKFQVDINPGEERNAPIKVGSMSLYPDLVLTENDGGRKPYAVVEVETGESVNHLEAMAQWAHFARSRAAFYLFVPVGSVESARRLMADHAIEASELWTYLTLGEQVRFTTVFRAPAAEAAVDRTTVDKAPVEKASAQKDHIQKGAAHAKTARVAVSRSAKPSRSVTAARTPSPRRPAARRKASAQVKRANAKRGTSPAKHAPARVAKRSAVKRSAPAQKRK
jgi:hypothetical protein